MSEETPTRRCTSRIAHESGVVLQCQSGHEPFLPFPLTHGTSNGIGWRDGDPRIIERTPESVGSALVSEEPAPRPCSLSSCHAAAAAAYALGVSEGRRQAAEDGEAGIPREVVALLFKLYDTVWNKVATYDGGPEGYSLVTWADQMLLDNAAEAIEPHEPMLRTALAELLDPPGEPTEQPEPEDATDVR